mgnify:CR=1 FL=1
MTADPTWRDVALDAATALALLEWQREMGVDEAILDAPLDRFAESIRPSAAAADPAPVAAPTLPPAAGGLAGQAEALAARAGTLAALAEAQGGDPASALVIETMAARLDALGGAGPDERKGDAA